MTLQTSSRSYLGTWITALLIGLSSFWVFDSRSQLRKWHAPATLGEMKSLVRGALELRTARNDASRLTRLDQFADVVSDLPHWQKEDGLAESTSPYTIEELHAFIDDLAPYYNDEWAKPAETYYYYLFWYRRDFASPDWSSNVLARTNPTVSKFLLGLAIDLQTPAPYPFQSARTQELFHDWWAFEPFLLAAQDRVVLLAARRTSAAFGGGSLMLVFLIGRRLGRRIGFATGLMAALLLYSSPIFHDYAIRATVDVMLVFFLLASAWVTTYFVPLVLEFQPGDRWGCARLCCATVVLGILSGLTFGMKLNGSLIGVGAAVACALGYGIRFTRWLRTRAENERLCSARCLPGAGALAVIAIVTWTVFFATNPYYYHDSLRRFRHTLREMDEVIAHCQAVLGPAIGSRFEAAKAVFYYGAMLTGKDGSQMMSRSRTAPFQQMDRRRVVAPVRFWIRTLLALAGLLAGVCALGIDAYRNGGYRAGLCCGLMGWALTLIVGSVLWLPLRWDRYILIPLTPCILLVSYGWCVAVGSLLQWAKTSIFEPPTHEVITPSSM